MITIIIQYPGDSQACIALTIKREYGVMATSKPLKKQKAKAPKKTSGKSKSKNSVNKVKPCSKIRGFFAAIGKFFYRIFWHNKFGRFILFAFIAWVVFAVGIITWYQARHWNDKTELGVSYSLKYADELGIDWQEGFIALAENAGFRRFRFMSYWDMHETENDVYDFSRLDWLFDEAHKYGAKVDLGMGERQPRWPECHRPVWTEGMSTEQFDNELMEYIEVVTNRYKDHPALDQYQLENEIFNNLFGDCEAVDRSRVQAEFDLIKHLDPEHPVVINVSNQSGTPFRQPVGDGVGFSVYFVAWGDWTGVGFYFHFWHVPPIWHSYRAGIIELMHGTDTETFIHELQTEPWGPGATVGLDTEEQERSMSVDELEKRVRFGEQTGMSKIFMWGGEWWYWRMTELGDDRYWNAAKELVDERPYQFIEN